MVDHPRAVSTYEAATKAIGDEVAAAPLPARGAILRIDTTSIIGLFRGVYDRADRQGRSLYVDDDLGFELGAHRARAVDEVDEVWWVAESGSRLGYLEGLPGARRVAYSTPLSPADDATAAELQRSVYRQLVAAGHPELARDLDSNLLGFSIGTVAGVDPVAVSRLAALNDQVLRSGTCRCGVVALPAAAAPLTLPW